MSSQKLRAFIFHCFLFRTNLFTCICISHAAQSEGGDGCHNYQLQGNVNKAVPPSEEAITSGCK